MLKDVTPEGIYDHIEKLGLKHVEQTFNPCHDLCGAISRPDEWDRKIWKKWKDKIKHNW